MKRFIPLFIASLLALTITASGRDPVIKLNASNNKYEIRIDGRAFVNAGDIHLFEGMHKVEVYKIKKVFLGKRKVLVSQADFDFTNSDLVILVDDAGQVNVNDLGKYAAGKENGSNKVQKKKA